MTTKQIEIAIHRRKRLAELAEKIGGLTALGRKLGYRDGAFVGQMIRGERPITEKTVLAVHALHEFSEWFEPTRVNSKREAQALLSDALLAIQGLRGQLRQLPPEILSQLPKDPAANCEWLDVLQHDLQEAILEGAMGEPVTDQENSARDLHLRPKG